MTPKQLGFIATLAAERTLPENTRGTYIRNLVAGTATQPNAAQASKMIEWLLELPKATVETGGVAEGRYAVVSEAGITEFFKVDAPSEGKWAGYVFVKQQASDDLFPVKGARKADVLARIAADPDALARYGQELGVCGRCGRTLTDEVSRAMGIGPECAKIVGAIRPSVEEVVAPAAIPVPTQNTEVVQRGDEYLVRPRPERPSATRKPTLGWRERKAAVKAQQAEGIEHDSTPRPCSQIQHLPGSSWEDIFAS